LDRDQLLQKLQAKLDLLAQDPDYWRGIFPKFTISDYPFEDLEPPYAFDPKAAAKCVEQMREEGYFTTPPVIPADELANYVECITLVKKHREPRFALVYDAFYRLMARLSHILSPVLGEGYYFIPDEFDIYYIDTSDEEAGTPPHRDSLRVSDGFREDRRPTLINVWIPFTDVHTDNSCIHILPAQYDPHFAQFGHYSADDVRELSFQSIPMQDVRALPAHAGSILSWTPQLLHCGARSSKYASNPRISMSVYFQSRDVRPYHKFTMPMSGRLPLSYRLYLIEKFIKDPRAMNNDFQDLQQLWHEAQNS